MLILNIAGGKFPPLNFPEDNLMLPKYILNVDTSYYSGLTPSYAEMITQEWLENPDRTSKTLNINSDIFEFMERYSFQFNRACIYRFLEHVSFTQVEYFIYLVSTVLKADSLVDVIVPNYRILAEMIINEENKWKTDSFDFQPWNILLTTELLNEPSCPHASIWTPERIKYFWELEGRFEVIETSPVFKFDGRDIYLRSKIRRI